MKIALAMAVGAAAFSALAAPAMAHHSAAMFDRQKEVTLTGTVKELQWTNPHAWLQVVVRQGAKDVEWSFETEGPNVLTRAGIKRSLLAPATVVTVKGHPLKDGRPGASLISVQTSDGAVLSLNPALRKGPRGAPATP
jgi:hypothetical protein